MEKTRFWVMLAQFPLAWEWLTAGWEKITSGGFGADFATGLSKTLPHFETAKSTTGQMLTNPNSWYTNSFLKLAENNSTTFGYLVEFGEIFVGIVLLVAIIYTLTTKKALPTFLFWLATLSLVIGLFLNFNFYFASGWNNQSSASVNLIMILSEIIFICYYLTDGKKKTS